MRWGCLVSLALCACGRLATGLPYDNRFNSIITIENRKIVRWRDYMDSLAAWMALNREAS